MIKLGITGGIGSGKSTALKNFKKLNAITFDADIIAKDLLITNKNLMRSIQKEFGNEIYKSGKLNEDLLAKIAFSSAKTQNKLNELVHPYVRKFLLNEFEKCKNQNFKMVVVEASMLLEANIQNDFDYILVVTADKEKRLKRIKNRKIDLDSIEQRMKYQMSEKDKIKYADFVIHNNKSIQNMETQCKNIWLKIKEEQNYEKN
ncbi:MAG: dephospho-CoA kinase [Candidatus Marinimicrobia bacterium]|jgi:dephospho-CoA kinase|nr:dephospho-CoA kinase [Candidatus Neomarinimicrobiota bacterium]